MLDKLYQLPRFLLVALLLTGSILFIVLSDPPHNLCTVQIEQFKKIEKGILFKNIKSQLSECKAENVPGSCYELFDQLNRMLRHFRIVSNECINLLANVSVVKKTLTESFQLITHLAWREEILSNKVSKFYWLSAADMHLFCKIKNTIISFYGRDFYLNFSEKTILSLPGANKHNPDYIRKRSIISESCLKYS